MSIRDTAYETSRSKPQTAYDMGLRKHMLSVYNYMASGILLTGIVAMLSVRTGLTESLFSQKDGTSLLGYLVIFAPLAYVFLLGKTLRDGSLATGQIVYWSFTAVMGLSMSTIFLQYTGTSIATTFFGTSAAFAGLSLYGYSTKRDLGPLGAFLIMGLIGLIAMMVINLFVGSSAMAYVLSCAGVLIFAGLTAYDTQKIKGDYRTGVSAGVNEKQAIWGAMSLYLDFVNLMLFFLNIFGDRKG
jgi:FtsH-binding integral membrane protein